MNKLNFINILKILNTLYPKVKCWLEFDSPFQLLIATMLSAQCTDRVVNQVTKKLFVKYKTPKDFVQLDLEILENLIKPTWFYKNKAKNINLTSKMILQKFWWEIPNEIDKLILLPWVWRKTANVVLWNAFWISSWIVVDTHVSRITQRLWFTKEKVPEKIEKDLINVIPKWEWINFSHRIIQFGRDICIARSPRCEICELKNFCKFYKKL